MKTTFKKFEVIIVCLERPYRFNFFKGCIPQISLGPFLNILTQIKFSSYPYALIKNRLARLVDKILARKCKLTVKALNKPILAQCSISIPNENIRKAEAS